MRCAVWCVAMAFMVCARAVHCAPDRYALATVALDRTQVQAGGLIRATYTFRAGPKSMRPLWVFVHLTPADPQGQFGADFQPLMPTTTWPTNGFVRLQPQTIDIRPNVKPGIYRLYIGMYDRESGERQQLDNPNRDDGSQRYHVADIEVVAAGQHADARPVQFRLLAAPEAQVRDEAQMLEKLHRSRRATPKKPVVVRTDQLTAILDGNDGVPYQYQLPNGVKVVGEAWGGSPLATVFRKDGRGTRSTHVVPTAVKATKTRADFSFVASFDGAAAVSFVLRYALSGGTMVVTLEQVKEYAGYELFSVELPSLATVYGSDKKAWLAYPENGGSWAEVAKASPAALRWTTNWSYPAPVALIGTATAQAVLEAPSFDDSTLLSVTGAQTAYRRAYFGVCMAWREPGGPTTPNTRVNQKSVCRVSVLPSGSWLDGANTVAKRLPKVRTHYYDDKFMYKIFQDMPGAANYTPFAKAGELIRRVAALIDYAPQVAYLVGWQNEGHDSKYPSVDVVNKRLGGYEGLMQAMADGRKVNCTVSLHDNYDDAYMDSPGWNPDFIAKDQNGKLMAGGIWAGGQSYIIGEARYAAGPGIERVRYTCKRYGIRDTYHIDVMSAAPLRSDWDPSHPASVVDNLRGKWAIIDEFAKQGVDVTSEGLSWPFIGKMSLFWNSPVGVTRHFGNEEAVPLVSALFRRSACWAGSNAEGDGPLLSLFYNKSFSNDLVPDSVQNGVDGYYLIQIPWRKLHAMPLQGFHRDGERVVLSFGGGTRVDIDFANHRYCVTVDGVEIARDFATFAPLDDRRVAFYSREARELSTPLPKGWDASGLRAYALHADGEPQPVTVKCDGRKVTISVAAHQPVIVYRSGKPTQLDIQR